MTQATRTLNPLHFEDLEPHRFEDMVRQLAYDYRTWRRLEATGRLGSDDGLDIRGVEVVPLTVDVDLSDEEDLDDPPPAEERRWSIQCKRYKSINPSLMRQTVADTVPDATQPPYGLVVAAACDVTKKTMDAFREEARLRGVQEWHLWTKAHLEDMLFQPRHDHLLFAYFNISLTARRRSQSTAIRHRLSIKRKIHRALADVPETEALRSQYRKAVLVRDVEDTAYPQEEEVVDFGSLAIPPWHLAMAEHLHSSGLLVCKESYVGWLPPDGKWDIAEDGPNLIAQTLDRVLPSYYERDTRRQVWQESSNYATQIRETVPDAERADIEVWRLVPFDNIVEVDPLGDPLYNVPHIYCTYYADSGPYYEKRLYRRVLPSGSQQTNWLDPAKRARLFEPSTT